MLVSMIKGDKLMNTTLPNRVYGNYWLTDFDHNNIEYNLINIEANANKWFLRSNEDYAVFDGKNYVQGVWLEDYQFYTIKNVHTQANLFIYCSPENDSSNVFLDINQVRTLSIGRGNQNTITFNSSRLNDEHAMLTFENDKYYIKDLNSINGVFVNSERIRGVHPLSFGDVIFIMGLKIIVLKDKNGPYLIVNNPEKLVSFHSNRLANKVLTKKAPKQDWFMADEYETMLYEAKDYFYTSPRFQSSTDIVTITIDPPPQEEKQDETPAALIVGPMITMGMTSFMSALTTLSGVANNTMDLDRAIPSLIVAGAMLMSMLFWPTVNRRYQKRRRKKRELARQVKYGKYIDKKKEEIEKEVETQTNIAKNNQITLQECESIILNKKRNLWERHFGKEDFLNVSLGHGNIQAKIDVKYPEEHFSMDDDKLRQMVYALGSVPRELINVPVKMSLTDKATAIIGDFYPIKMFMDGIFLQLLTFHPYNELKIMMITNPNHEEEWSYLKSAPHIFSDDKKVRYFATNQSETKELMYVLNKIYQARTSEEAAHTAIRTHYLVVTDNFRLLRTFDTVRHILADERNLGISFVIINKDLAAVPSECTHIVNITEQSAFMIERILNSNNNVKFNLDVNPYINMKECCKRLANIPLDLDLVNGESIQNKFGFLEMYDVGKIEQLNVLNRWSKNSPIHSLNVPIGIGASGDLITLDLHEKYHGPHGLIAGTTGSGKSEFIITYILSLAVNYHPDEVQFILIDYKGGGLALAFYNQETGVRLPHLSGTITNLDSNEINRSLASIESELKRRQRMFNEARNKSNDSTIDIYKYQQLYRDGKVDEPISHLFIICDEFAELKTQQAEFMQQLISTARVGRSLGVHLILATQKPSGVVDAQIWSNTRFRVCLKVQEKQDSAEVIKCPDAAYLKQTGRFFLQVGYNEIFQLGQAAWAGGAYMPSEKRKKMVDTSLDFIDNIGRTVKTIDQEVQQVQAAKGEELSNLVYYLDNLAKSQNIEIHKLWLDKIPGFILLDHLKQKYPMETPQFTINPIIGEYDIPARQMQKALTLPLTKEGNAVIYGASGSGKDNFITTFIYALMEEKTSKEVNIYILDFGSGALRGFKDAKIVGDYVTSSEEEKIVNLYKMLLHEVDVRKKEFQDYNGDYTTYVKNSGKSMPNIVVILNGYEVYNDLYEQYNDALVELSREATKYGIYFVVTASTPNGLKMKLRQNINQVFVLQQNSENDYISILGNVHKQYPSKLFGRGIIKLDDIYEFQTAFVCEKDKVSTFIKEKSSESVGDKARRIPILPDVVDKSTVDEYKEDGYAVIGIAKNTLEVAKYDYMKSAVDIISMQDIDSLNKFIHPFLAQLEDSDATLYVINTEDFKVDPTLKNVVTDRFNEFVSLFHDMMKKQLEENNGVNLRGKFKQIITVFVGFEAFRDQLSAEAKTKLQQIFTNGKKLGIYQFIIIDPINKLKKIEIEPWFKETANASNAIWLGSGITEQYTVKINKITRDLKEEIPDNFCYVVRRGVPTLVKFVEEYKNVEK